MKMITPVLAVAGLVLALAPAAPADLITDDVENVGDYTYKGASISKYDRPSGDVGVTSQAGARFMNTSGGNTTSRSGTFTFTPGGANTGFGTGNLIQAGTYVFTMSVGDVDTLRDGFATWSHRLQTTAGFLGGTAAGLNGATELPGGVVTDPFVPLAVNGTAEWTTTTITYTVPAGDPLIGQQFTWAADYTKVPPVEGFWGVWDAVSINFTPIRDHKIRMADTYPLEGKVGISRTWTDRGGSRVVARLVSAQGNRVVLATAEQKTVTIAFIQLVKKDQLYLVTPLPGLKGDFLGLSLYVGETEIPDTKDLASDDEFVFAGSRFRAERVRLDHGPLALQVHSLRTKKVYGPVQPKPGAEITVGGLRMAFREGEQRRLNVIEEATAPAPAAQADLIAGSKEATIDWVTPGTELEESHNQKGESSYSGPASGGQWRDARRGGWFSYDMNVLPDQPVFARVRYWGGDSKTRIFDILVDDRKIATQELNASKPGQFMDVDYEIPSDLTKGKQRVTVKFQAHPGAIAGGIFGCRIMTSNPRR